MLDYWLARRQRRIEISAAGWTATLFVLPGFLFAAWEQPVTLNTIDGYELFWHGGAAGAGVGAGLALALHGVWRDARAEWFGFVLCLFLAGGAAAIHWNAEQPVAERKQVASHVVDSWTSHGRHSRRGQRRQWLRSVAVDWQGRTVRLAVDRDLVLREGSAVVLSVYEGRLGYSVVERIHRVD